MECMSMVSAMYQVSKDCEFIKACCFQWGFISTHGAVAVSNLKPQCILIF